MPAVTKSDVLNKASCAVNFHAGKVASAVDRLNVTRRSTQIANQPRHIAGNPLTKSRASIVARQPQITAPVQHSAKMVKVDRQHVQQPARGEKSLTKEQCYYNYIHSSQIKFNKSA